jgi:hypothetical protein
MIAFEVYYLHADTYFHSITWSAESNLYNAKLLSDSDFVVEVLDIHVIS